jgi:hypothetical protein
MYSHNLPWPTAARPELRHVCSFTRQFYRIGTSKAIELAFSVALKLADSAELEMEVADEMLANYMRGY